MSPIENENQFAELVAFIRDKTGEHEMPITRETLIEGDLGVSGLDAEHLIVEFSNKYNIDISNFRFKAYFNDEPGIFDFLTDRKIKPFTIGHLERAIIAGRLDEEIINA